MSVRGVGSTADAHIEAIRASRNGIFESLEAGEFALQSLEGEIHRLEDLHARAVLGEEQAIESLRNARTQIDRLRASNRAAPHEVCACVDDVGGRQVEIVERCLRCGLCMDSDAYEDALADLKNAHVKLGEKVKEMGEAERGAKEWEAVARRYLQALDQISDRLPKGSINETSGDIAREAKAWGESWHS